MAPTRGVQQGSSLRFKVAKESGIDQFYNIILSLFLTESINSFRLRIIDNPSCQYLLKNYTIKKIGRRRGPDKVSGPSPGFRMWGP